MSTIKDLYVSRNAAASTADGIRAQIFTLTGSLGAADTTTIDLSTKLATVIAEKGGFVGPIVNPTTGKVIILVKDGSVAGYHEQPIFSADGSVDPDPVVVPTVVVPPVVAPVPDPVVPVVEPVVHAPADPASEFVHQPAHVEPPAATFEPGQHS